MNDSTQKSAMQLLKLPLTAFIIAFIAAAMFVAGGYYYLQYQKKSEVTSGRVLQDAQARVANANKEAEDLRGSVGIYQQLVAYGAFNPENRMDWIEVTSRLKAKHKIIAVEFALAPQRTIQPADGRVFPSIDVMGSRVSLKAKAYHDGDLVAFLGDFANLGRGFYPMDHCAIHMLAPVPGTPLAPRIEASCALDWVTLRDKRAPVLVSSEGRR